MEEEVENTDQDSNSPQLRKKYVTIWRNKWITSNAGSIDEFIKIYEGLAEMMKSWKAQGILLDPDIIGSVGDDYAQFCTYDKVVAVKEGFEEETSEEDAFEGDLEVNTSAIFKDWDNPPQPHILEYPINEFLSLKLQGEYIEIFVDGEIFNQCRYLLIIDPLRDEQQEEIDSIDEAETFYSNNLEERIRPEELGITKEQEFWAHCSNLEAWAENNYDTRLLHSNLSFPLLKKLTEVGDVKASKVFKEEIAQRFVRGYIPVIRYLFQEKFVDYLTPEEFNVILENLDYNALNLNLLLTNIEDYRASIYGTQFLLKVRDEHLEFFKNNNIYVEVVSHKLDKSEYTPVVITPDRQFFIRGSNDGKLKEFCIFKGELVRVFGEHKGAVSRIDISLDGKYIASSSDTIVKVWDYKSGTLIHCFSGHKDHVNTLAFDPESHFLASGSSNGEKNECAIKIWDLKKGKLKTTKSSHWDSVTSLSFSFNGDFLVSGAYDKTVNVWDTTTGRHITTLVGHNDPVIDVAITDDGRVISASYDGIMKIWDSNTGIMIKEMGFKLENSKQMFQVVSFVLTPNQKFIIGSAQRPSLEDGGRLFIYRISDGEIVQTLPIIQDFHGDREELNILTISNDGVFILSSSRERNVKVWMKFMEYMKFQEMIEDL